MFRRKEGVEQIPYQTLVAPLQRKIKSRTANKVMKYLAKYAGKESSWKSFSTGRTYHQSVYNQRNCTTVYCFLKEYRWFLSSINCQLKQTNKQTNKKPSSNVAAQLKPFIHPSWAYYKLTV